jgi:hypothetical protein
MKWPRVQIDGIVTSPVSRQTNQAAVCLGGISCLLVWKLVLLLPIISGCVIHKTLCDCFECCAISIAKLYFENAGSIQNAAGK